MTTADGPWSGRSDAISTSGVRPPASTGPHADAGRVLPWGAPATDTHARSSSAATEGGVPASAIVRVTRFVRGSTRTTSSVTKFVTQTAPAPKATEVTPKPMSIGRGTASRAGSTRQRIPVTRSVAHTEPAPTARSQRPSTGRSMLRPGRLVSGSISLRARRSPVISQTPSAPAAIATPASTGTTASSSPVAGSSRETLASGLIAQSAPAPAASWLTPGMRSVPSSPLVESTAGLPIGDVEPGSTLATRAV